MVLVPSRYAVAGSWARCREAGCFFSCAERPGWTVAAELVQLPPRHRGVQLQLAEPGAADLSPRSSGLTVCGPDAFDSPPRWTVVRTIARQPGAGPPALQLRDLLAWRHLQRRPLAVG